MRIKMSLVSDLYLKNINKLEKKTGLVIQSDELITSLYMKAVEILNIFDKTDIEYINYKEIICILFKKEKNCIRISNGTLNNYKERRNFDDLIIHHLIEGVEISTIKKGCKFNFDIEMKLEKRYINFLEMCIIGTNYLGLYNNIGMGEVELTLL